MNDAYNAGVRNFEITGGEWTDNLGKSESITVHIKDGTFSMAQFYTHEFLTLTIDGGRFTAGSFQTVTGAQWGTSLVINDGYFEAGSMIFHSVHSGDGIGVEIYGGTFEDAPEPGVPKNYASHLADGYTAVQNSDGKWEVVPECTCTTKCSDLNDACERCKTDISLCGEGKESTVSVDVADPAILPLEGEKNGEEQESSDDQQGQE